MREADAVRELARRKGATPAQIALAWLLAKGDDVVPIPGTKRRTFLEENLGALKVQLTKDDLAELDAFFPGGRAAGERYSPQMARLIDR